MLFKRVESVSPLLSYMTPGMLLNLCASLASHLKWEHNHLTMIIVMINGVMYMGV